MKIISAFLLATMGYAACLDCTLASRIENPKPKRSEIGLSQVRIESPKPKRSEISLNQVAGPNLS